MADRYKLVTTSGLAAACLASTGELVASWSIGEIDTARAWIAENNRDRPDQLSAAESRFLEKTREHIPTDADPAYADAKAADPMFKGLGAPPPAALTPVDPARTVKQSDTPAKDEDALVAKITDRVVTAVLAALKP
jgi:hypothetical protein